MLHSLSSLFPFNIHIVKGHSMQPFLNEGDRVVVFRWAYVFSQPKKGDVVVFKHNDGKKYVKRIAAMANNNNGKKFFVAGDNEKDSKDSRNFGHINRKLIIGKIVASY